MKVVAAGNRYDIYENNLVVYDKLPSQCYRVHFEEKAGFSLVKYDDINIKGEKAYGSLNEKVIKVLNAFGRTNRNLGVLLSGDKGIGKSFFSKMLCDTAVKRDIPVIVVDKYEKGIVNYLETIQQEVLIMFDEYDKIIASQSRSCDNMLAEAELLTLFDGMSSGKKLFVITCNSIKNISDYLVNRPGRFHYHFRFAYPTAKEIEQYLKDNLDEKYWSEIDKVVKFSIRVQLNYDCLRAIVFELSNGESFNKCIQDLNIVNTKDLFYNMTLYLEDGTTLSTDRSINIDMFNTDENSGSWLCDKYGARIVFVNFDIKDAIYNTEKDEYTVDGENVRIEWDDDLDGDERVEHLKKLKHDKLIVKQKKSRALHYSVD